MTNGNGKPNGNGLTNRTLLVLPLLTTITTLAAGGWFLVKTTVKTTSDLYDARDKLRAEIQTLSAITASTERADRNETLRRYLTREEFVERTSDLRDRLARIEYLCRRYRR